MLLASVTGPLLVGLGETFSWGAYWRLLHWVGVGLIAAVGFSPISLSVRPSWLLAGLLGFLNRSPLWPASRVSAADNKSRSSKSAEAREV